MYGGKKERLKELAQGRKPGKLARFSIWRRDSYAPDDEPNKPNHPWIVIPVHWGVRRIAQKSHRKAYVRYNRSKGNMRNVQKRICLDSLRKSCGNLWASQSPAKEMYARLSSLYEDREADLPAGADGPQPQPPSQQCAHIPKLRPFRKLTHAFSAEQVQSDTDTIHCYLET